MEHQLDPLSLLAQLLREITPSDLDIRQQKAREKERIRRRSSKEREKTRARMRKLRNSHAKDKPVETNPTQTAGNSESGGG